MGKQGIVGEMPETGAVVRHAVGDTGNVCDAGQVSELSLVQGLEPEKVCGGPCGGCTAFRLPCGRGGVVRESVNRPLPCVDRLRDNVVVRNCASQFEVRVRYCARRIRKGDKARLCLGCERRTPEDGLVASRGQGKECDATHAGNSRVGRTHDVWCCRNDFAKSSRALGKGGGQSPEVIQKVMELGGQGDTGPIIVAQGLLHEAEEASKARNGAGHAAELAEYLVPLLGSDSFLGARKGMEDAAKALETTRRELDGFSGRINEPTEHDLAGGPGSISL